MVALVACGGPGSERVVVAAGTSLVDSGLMDALADQYESANPGVDVSVVGEASAQVLELGRRGAADVLVTHAPALEEAFLADGLAELSEIAFTSEFVLVGPPALEDRLRGTIEDVLIEIAAGELEFVSRGDGSGTHEREVELWNAAGIDPGGEPWYRKTGQGMGLTLIVADQRLAITLSERGSFVAAADQLDLQVLDVSAGPGLLNPYRVTLVVGRTAAAADFAKWLIDGAPAGLSELNRSLFDEDDIYRPAD
ncbi:MAG TPA: tungsten ABC transporter substrate-binding protein [Actinobacteria bacterium]|nr:tungsten ABC transporter substrate-binding protein [Actinomycetota bacterium]